LLSESRGDAEQPSLTWDGSRFVMVWPGAQGVKVSPSGEITPFTFPPTSYPSVARSAFMQIILADDTPPHVVITNGSDISTLDLRLLFDPPQLVPLPDGRLALLYTDALESDAFVPRVFARIVSDSATAP
jgi:hypothetical protein